MEFRRLRGPLSAAIATAWVAASVAKGKEMLRATRAAVVIVLGAAMPVVFDPHTGDVFNIPRYTLVVTGAVVLTGLWVVAAVHYRSAPRWRTGCSGSSRRSSPGHWFRR